ncbi:DUF3137 domain-containing protein [uncultured Draconibacterium sp.]|uniref:DUF3137 domain-containing protein n=1 Tax=uncultured Draconibacterium sp. TaxID=1573823 RepID=UPI003216C1E5
MNSIEKLKSLYENQLKPELAGLEKQRKTVAWLYRIVVALYSCAGLTFISIFIQANKIENNAVFMGFGVMFGCVFLGLILNLVPVHNLRKKYRLAYKNKVVKSVIATIEPEWKYQADAHVGALDFKSSKLFSRPYSIFRGDDLVTGEIGKTDFRSSELEVKYQVGSGDNTEYHNLFSGFFFSADFNKNFSGETYVVHGDIEAKVNTLRSLSEGRSTTKKRGEFVQLENPEFTKLFTVRSTGQQEARYLLTPRIMEALVKLHTKYPHPTHISFIGKRVYFAIAFDKQLFEARIFKPVANFDEVEKLYHLFMLNAEIIGELSLNTRIWTKQ